MDHECALKRPHPRDTESLCPNILFRKQDKSSFRFALRVHVYGSVSDALTASKGCAAKVLMQFEAGGFRVQPLGC